MYLCKYVDVDVCKYVCLSVCYSYIVDDPLRLEFILRFACPFPIKALLIPRHSVSWERMICLQLLPTLSSAIAMPLTLRACASAMARPGMYLFVSVCKLYM